MDRPRQKNGIGWLFIGEGEFEPGPACRKAEEILAQRGEEAVYVVDPANPKYPLPKNIKWIHIDALAWLERRESGSISNIMENYAFECITMGSADYAVHLKIYKKALRDMEKDGHPTSFRKVMARGRRYAKVLYRALADEGRLTLITSANPEKGMNNERMITDHLSKAGFLVNLRQLTPEEVTQCGSHQAQADLEKYGSTIYMITATKPAGLNAPGKLPEKSPGYMEAIRAVTGSDEGRGVSLWEF